VRLASGTVIANYHASTREALAEAELGRLWQLAREWAPDGPIVLGGDLNLRAPESPGGAIHAAARDVDHVFVLGLEPVGPARVLERAAEVGGAAVELSDHPPLLVELAPGGG
jgi:endonuclease/exonuclease/phosphatase (EEP) superfamily protein YafD